jgi:CO/xanthine dehydrogenase FAD-binding subunit
MTEYLFPASMEEAVACLARFPGEARIIAGGTDVLPDLRKGKIAPQCLVDITRIAELHHIEESAGYIQVGAAVTFSDLRSSELLSRHVPALADAAASVGAPGIQNVATWVGNIVQAMPAADGAIVALALEAEARVVAGQHSEWRPVESLFRGPGVSAIDPARQLVTHLRFPIPQTPWGTAWQRVGRRPSLVLPILNCAVKLCLHPGTSEIAQATIALGPVAPRPLRARAAEQYLLGRPATPQHFQVAAQLASEESDPRTSITRASRDYRLTILPSLVSDALVTALARAQQVAHARSETHRP